MCPTCDRETRVCVRCGKPVPRAGRKTPEGVCCLSCAPHFRPKERCDECGSPSSQLTRINGEGPRLCLSCRNSRTHGTCSWCHRYRPVETRAEDGRFFCASCSDEKRPVHVCPGCGTSVPGAGSGSCRACIVKAKVAVCIEAEKRSNLLRWTEPVLDRYGETVAAVPTATNIPERITKAAGALARIAGEFEASTLTHADLARLFGPTRLRPLKSLIDVLMAHCACARKPSAIAAVNAATKIESLLLQGADEETTNILRGYLTWLQRRPKRVSPRTTYGYLRAANAFLGTQRFTSLEDLEPSRLNGYAHRHKGDRGNLTSFARWLSEETGKSFAVPAPRRTNPKTLEERAIQKKIRIIAGGQNPASS